MYRQASGIVEAIKRIAGAALVASMSELLPYALAFAAGAMIYVMVEESIPEAQSGSHEETHLTTIGCIIGFAVIIMLDVAL